MVAGSELIRTKLGQREPDVMRVGGSHRRTRGMKGGERRELSNLFPPPSPLPGAPGPQASVVCSL